MSGKQAKAIGRADFKRLLNLASIGPLGLRNRAIVLLSYRAGLRAGEIAKLEWSMIMTVDGNLSNSIELYDKAAKRRGGRTIPMNPDLRRALQRLWTHAEQREGPVILSERGKAMLPGSIVRRFRKWYRTLGLVGCSSHSGRRTFITTAARKVHLTGGSLRDVQQLAGHSSILHTQTYIDGSETAKRRLVALI